VVTAYATASAAGARAPDSTVSTSLAEIDVSEIDAIVYVLATLLAAIVFFTAVAKVPLFIVVMTFAMVAALKLLTGLLFASTVVVMLYAKFAVCDNRRPPLSNRLDPTLPVTVMVLSGRAVLDASSLATAASTVASATKPAID